MDNDHLYKGLSPNDLYSSSISCTVNGKRPVVGRGCQRSGQSGSSFSDIPSPLHILSIVIILSFSEF